MGSAHIPWGTSAEGRGVMETEPKTLREVGEKGTEVSRKAQV